MSPIIRRVLPQLPLIALTLAASFFAACDKNLPTEPGDSPIVAASSSLAASPDVSGDDVAGRGVVRERGALREGGAIQPAERLAERPIVAEAKGGKGGKGGNGGKGGGGKGGGGNGGNGGGGNGGGSKPRGELSLAVQPDTWNTNWAGSNGTVSFKITGDGLAGVDLDSIVLVGTDDEAEPLEALRASRNGNHIRVFFAKSDAIKTLDTPAAGEKHEIVIRLTVAGAEGEEGAEKELKDEIRVVGPAR